MVSLFLAHYGVINAFFISTETVACSCCNRGRLFLSKIERLKRVEVGIRDGMLGLPLDQTYQTFSKIS